MVGQKFLAYVTSVVSSDGPSVLLVAKIALHGSLDAQRLEPMVKELFVRHDGERV
jgi:hypothetical protein